MEWMTEACRKESTGEGYCKKFERYVKKKCKKDKEGACEYAEDLGIEVKKPEENDDPLDSDGDGVEDADDAFPDNPLEWKDSDGDGVGDNNDRWPNDSSCADEGDVCASQAQAPAPAAAASAAGPPPPGLQPAAAPGPAMDAKAPLPSQGYSEHSSKLVTHDETTMTSDWRAEWPMRADDEDASLERICAKNPKLMLCKLTFSSSARDAFAASHP